MHNCAKLGSIWRHEGTAVSLRRLPQRNLMANESGSMMLTAGSFGGHLQSSCQTVLPQWSIVSMNVLASPHWFWAGYIWFSFPPWHSIAQVLFSCYLHGGNDGDPRQCQTLVSTTNWNANSCDWVQIDGPTATSWSVHPGAACCYLKRVYCFQPSTLLGNLFSNNKPDPGKPPWIVEGSLPIISAQDWRCTPLTHSLGPASVRATWSTSFSCVITRLCRGV